MTAPGAGSLENFRRQMEVGVEALNHVIPGVLDSTTNIVGHPEVVADRPIRYAGVVG